MKGSGWKYTALVAALGSCLLLTACYIAPDDVSTGGATGTANSLPFQTLAPTATVTIEPDIVVVETQNVFGTNPQQISTTDSSATPSPTPSPGQGTAGGWNDWGTVQETAGVESQTPLPVQTKLDGTVVLTTRTPDPESGQTQTKATEGIGVITAAPAVTKAPATPSPTPQSLQVGFTGSDEVRALQKRLKELGYYSGAADGDFGPATEKAVKAFQKANGLTADGKAGKQTLAKLNSGSAITAKQANATATPKATSKTTAKATAKATATPRPTATPNLTKEYYLQLGSSGSKVRTLQNRLISLGWLGGKATGTYDEATEAAVRAFQKKTSGLYEDGVAGPDTLKAIYSVNAAKSASVAASSGETLELGSEGSEVRALQKRLKELGYLSGSVDGSFGVATQAAVIAFQQNNGLTADGKAGTATLNKLYSDSAVKSGGGSASLSDGRSGGTSGSTEGGRDTSGIASTGYVTLSEGDEGSEVKKLQQKLKDKGYYTGSVDGKFGEATTASVMAFQLRNNLTVDGKAGPATQRALYDSGSSISYSALRQGDEGTAVRNLQYTLYELGYYDGAIDGSYGQTTSDAVRAFQIQNDLSPVDGVAGSATLAKMYSSNAIPASAAKTSYSSVRPGDTGDVVVQIQDCLVQMGYLDRITGTYDDDTTNAVKAFQKENGLTADGVAGEKTLMILFGY